MRYIVVKRTIREEIRAFDALNEEDAYAQIMETDHQNMKIVSDDTWLDNLDWFAEESIVPPSTDIDSLVEL